MQKDRQRQWQIQRERGEHRSGTNTRDKAADPNSHHEAHVSRFSRSSSTSPPSEPPPPPDPPPSSDSLPPHPDRPPPPLLLLRWLFLFGVYGDILRSTDLIHNITPPPPQYSLFLPPIFLLHVPLRCINSQPVYL